jgi:hypothetical protein
MSIAVGEESVLLVLVWVWWVLTQLETREKDFFLRRGGRRTRGRGGARGRSRSEEEEEEEELAWREVL